MTTTSSPTASRTAARARRVMPSVAERGRAGGVLVLGPRQREEDDPGHPEAGQAPDLVDQRRRPCAGTRRAASRPAGARRGRRPRTAGRPGRRRSARVWATRRRRAGVRRSRRRRRPGSRDGWRGWARCSSLRRRRVPPPVPGRRPWSAPRRPGRRPRAATRPSRVCSDGLDRHRRARRPRTDALVTGPMEAMTGGQPGGPRRSTVRSTVDDEVKATASAGRGRRRRRPGRRRRPPSGRRRPRRPASPWRPGPGRPRRAPARPARTARAPSSVARPGAGTGGVRRRERLDQGVRDGAPRAPGRATIAARHEGPGRRRARRRPTGSPPARSVRRGRPTSRATALAEVTTTHS